MSTNQNIYQSMQLDDTLVKIAQEAYLKSCKESKREVNGEKYVSHDPQRKNKIVSAKQVITTVAAVAVAAITINGGLKMIDDFGRASAIKQEVFRTEIYQNPIGGRYETKSIYDDDFATAMTNLSNSALSDLYDSTSQQMVENGKDEDAHIFREVVEQMEENYLEEQGKSK